MVSPENQILVWMERFAHMNPSERDDEKAQEEVFASIAGRQLTDADKQQLEALEKFSKVNRAKLAMFDDLLRHLDESHICTHTPSVTWCGRCELIKDAKKLQRGELP